MLDLRATRVSRRELFGIAATTCVLVAISPDITRAETIQGSDMIEVTRSDEARHKWEEAVRRAALEGEPVYYGLGNEAAENLSNASRAIGSPRTVSTSKNMIIASLPNTIIISANYGVTSAGKISPFNWAAIYVSAGKIISSYYNRAILDGGRTNAIYYHAEIRDVADITTYVGDFYCEFYNSFTGHFY